jgi:hypothetical protein
VRFVRNALFFSLAICLTTTTTAIEASPTDSALQPIQALAGFRPPMPSELELFGRKQALQSARRTRSDGVSVVVMSARVPADRVRLLEDYADRVLDEVNLHSPEGRQPQNGKSVSIAKYPVSAYESVWVIRSSGPQPSATASGGSEIRAATCSETLPEFNNPSVADIIVVGQVATQEASVSVDGFKHTRTAQWLARHRDNDPNLGFEWMQTVDNCVSEEEEAPSPPDTEEAPSTSYSDGAIGGNEAPYTMVNGSWWNNAYSTACYSVRNNVNNEVVVLCFLV